MKNGTDIWYIKENEHIQQFNDLRATGNVLRTRRHSKSQVLCIITATYRCIQQWVHLACHQQHRNVDASITLAYEYEYIPSVGNDITSTGGVGPYVRQYVYLPAKGVRECYSNVCEYPFHQRTPGGAACSLARRLSGRNDQQSLHARRTHNLSRAAA